MNELSLKYGDKLIEDLDEREILEMDPLVRKDIITKAQTYCAGGGEITTKQAANLTRMLIHIRRKDVKDNPRATATARKAAEVQPASLDDI